jgi:hypothetical protein
MPWWVPEAEYDPSDRAAIRREGVGVKVFDSPDLLSPYIDTSLRVHGVFKG